MAMNWPWKFLSRHQKVRSKRHRQRCSDRPDPLPAVRQRALTLPLPPDNSNTSNWAKLARFAGCRRQRTCDQQSSAFFAKLPLEIRYMIYRQVLAPADGPELHVASAHKRLLSRRCIGAESDSCWRDDCWGRHFSKDGTRAPNPNSDRYEPEHELSPCSIRMGLLCSCRLIYSEAIDILYSQNTLSFYQTRTLVDLHRSILPQRLHSIRSLHLLFPLELYWHGERLEAWDSFFPLDIPHYWEYAWKVIGGMQSLRSLLVSFREHRKYVKRNKLIYLLKPMVAINVPKYAVELYWPVDVDELVQALGGTVPFGIHLKELPSWAASTLSGPL